MKQTISLNFYNNIEHLIYTNSRFSSLWTWSHLYIIFIFVLLILNIYPSCRLYIILIFCLVISYYFDPSYVAIVYFDGFQWLSLMVFAFLNYGYCLINKSHTAGRVPKLKITQTMDNWYTAKHVCNKVALYESLVVIYIVLNSIWIA